MFRSLLVFGILALPTVFGGVKSNPATFSSEIPQNNVVLQENSAETDEFLNYWSNDFRKDHISVCDITYESYKIMYSKFFALSESDRNYVSNLIDPMDESGTYTIGQVIEELANRFKAKPQENNRRTLDQKTTIIIVVVVAVFGMTTISILFILKNNKLIK